MALVTIQRSPSPSVDGELDTANSPEDFTDGRSQMRKSLSQSYFTVKGAALILPHTEFTKKSARKSHGGEIQNHLQAMLHLLRPEDTIQIAIRLEDTNQYQRYMALVSTKGRQDTEEAVMLGIDCNNTEALIGLVLPIWMGLQIKLGGDGGFSLCIAEQCYLFKPVSVQAMWSAIQSFAKVQEIADNMKYIPDGLTHTWVGYYRSHIDRQDSARVSQWNVEGVEVFAPSSLSIKSVEGDGRTEPIISQTLKEVMMTVDLDEATSKMLREAVEEKMNMSLAAYKSYFDEEVMRILGQMDEPSEILDFLYLGSEWNASNLDELSKKGIDYILNVTKEIDNFFEGRFHYCNVRVSDEEESDLLNHWEKTYRFISKARSQKSKVLVHCKMGVSRSASTVMAFLMKDHRWSVEEAFSFVKEHRSCVHPNSGFMSQLHMYEAILTASNKRDIFRSKSDQNLLDEGSKDETETSEGSFLGDSLFRLMSHSDWLSAYGGVAQEEEWIGSLQQDQVHDTDILNVDTDYETESRSADSMEDVLPDLPSPSSSEATEAAGYTVHPLLIPLTSSSLSSTRPCFGASSSDIEMAQELQCILETAPELAIGLSEGGGCSLLQASAGALSSRIKPDSSWIRLDCISTELEVNDSHNKLPFDESVPSPGFYANTQPHEYALDTAVTDTSNTFISEEERLQTAVNISKGSEMISAATTVPKSLPYFSHPDSSNLSLDDTIDDKIEAEFHIGSTQRLNKIPPSSVASNSCIIPGQSPLFCSSCGSKETTSLCHARVSSEQPFSSNLQDIDDKQDQVKQIPQHESSDQPSGELDKAQSDGRIQENPGQGKESKGVDPIDASKISSRSSQDRIQQHSFGDTIPWKVGKVRRMQEDTTEAGHTSDNIVEKNESMKTEVPLPQTTLLDASDDNRLLGQVFELQPPTALYHSHSCVELCAQGEGDQVMNPLYEREQIPMTPGTVLRTKLQIEGRQRLLSGEGGQEIFDSTHPVLRTSSLKHHRDTPRSRYTQLRRLSGPIMSPLTGKSLDDLSAGITQVKEISFDPSEHLSGDQVKDTAMELESELPSKCETCKVLPQSQFNSQPAATTLPSSLNNKFSLQTTVQSSAGDSKDKQPDSESSGSWSQDRAKGNFDSETLALIREIGSALSMSPTPPKPEETDDSELCTNMVRYFVKKIEQHTKIISPTRNIALINNNITMSHSDGATKFSLGGEIGSPSIKLSTFQSAPTLTSSDSPATSDTCSNQSIRQGFSRTTKIQDIANPDNIDPPKTSPTENTHKLSEVPGSSTLERKHNIAPTFLPVCRTEQATVAKATEESDPTHSPCSRKKIFGHDSAEESVVRNLVGRFEIKSPESERVSSEFDHECSYRFKDGNTGFSSACVCEKNPHEDSNIPQRPLEDPNNQTSPQSDCRLIEDNLLMEPYRCSLDPSVSLPLVQPTLLPQPLTFNPINPSTQNQPSVIKKNTFTFDVDPPELSKDASTSYKKDTPSAASSSFIDPQRYPYSSLKHPHQSGRSKSADEALPSVPSSANTHGRNERDGRSDATEFDDVFMRQVSDEGRKIRKLHGKSHPQTKLSDQRFARGPFYNSM